MSRPPNAVPELTQLRILDAAELRFGEEGLAGASIRRIAADAGVTLATVHHYFGSKQELFDRCVERGLLQLAGLQQELLAEVNAAGPLSPERLVRKGAQAALRFAAGRRPSTRFLLRATVFELDAPNRERLETAQRLYLELGSELLAPLTGRAPADLRVALQGLMFLIGRLAVSSEREREILGGDHAAPLAQLEEYAGEVAVATLLRPARS